MNNLTYKDFQRLINLFCFSTNQESWTTNSNFMFDSRSESFQRHTKRDSVFSDLKYSFGSNEGPLLIESIPGKCRFHNEGPFSVNYNKMFSLIIEKKELLSDYLIAILPDLYAIEQFLFRNPSRYEIEREIKLRQRLIINPKIDDTNRLIINQYNTETDRMILFIEIKHDLMMDAFWALPATDKERYEKRLEEFKQKYNVKYYEATRTRFKELLINNKCIECLTCTNYQSHLLDTQKICPKCKTPGKTQYCPKCGLELVLPNICTNCNKIVQTAFCPDCGRPIKGNLS